MFKSLFSRKSASRVAKGTISSGTATLMLTSALTVQADGSSSAGSGGGGTSNSSRAQSSGQLGSAASSISGGSTSSTGRNSDGGSRSGSSGSGGSGSGSGGSYGGSTMGVGTVTNGYESVTWNGVTQGAWEASMAANGASVTTHSATHSTANFGDGSSASWSGNSGGSGSGSSTPFISTWNGKKYVFDNDFLFGKPETAFDNYAAGVAAYKSGKTGGDTYLLKNHPKSENGVLKFQIKEIEPEESFIDSFKLVAMDMPENYHPVVDGNLKDTYIFDTTETKAADGQVATVHYAKTDKVSKLVNGYDKIGERGTSGEDTILNAGDSILINLPITSGNNDHLFLLVDSYFRDWSLGNEVPFSTVERVWINTVKTIKAVPVMGMALVMGLFGLFSKETNADIPRYSQSGYLPGGGGGGNYFQAGYSGGGGFTSYRSRSLVITAKVGDDVMYLQTLFPRYVQASQEVVRIPAELLKKAAGSVLEVCITATKKHKVRSAFLFTGQTKDKEVTYTDLETISAIKVSTNTDYAGSFSHKNGEFLHTTPGDVVNVEIKDAPRKDGYVRHYLLRADGFYTKISKQTKDLMGDKWYARLDSESKRLLRNLRVYKS